MKLLVWLSSAVEVSEPRIETRAQSPILNFDSSSYEVDAQTHPSSEIEFIGTNI